MMMISPSAIAAPGTFTAAWVLLLLAWIIASAVRWLTVRGLGALNLDKRLGDSAGVEEERTLFAEDQVAVGLLEVARLPDGIDHCQTWISGPAQNLHFRLVVGTEGTGAIHHVDDTCTRNHWPQHLAGFLVTAVAAVFFEKTAHRAGAAAGITAVLLQLNVRYKTRVAPKLTGIKRDPRVVDAG